MHVPASPPSKYKFAGVDLKLRDGKVIRNVAIDGSGQILGRIVGGQDGLDDEPLPFTQLDIVAFKPRYGLAARVGLGRWRAAN